MKWWPEECTAGDMVRVSIGSVKHYGVFVSENEIIQFGPPPVDLSSIDNSKIEVCTANAEEFSRGNIIERCILDKSEERKRLPREKTVELARSRIGEKGYSLLHNNCEHFAYQCVFGVKKSTQEDEARTRWNNRPIFDVFLAKLPDGLTPGEVFGRERRRELASTKNETLKKQRYYDWHILEYAAGRVFGLKPGELSFRKNAFGKWSCTGFEFSLSHSGGYVAVAVSNGSVGVDITSDSEQNYPGLRLKKEALFKALGHGFFAPSKAEADSTPVRICTCRRLPQCRFAVCGERLNSARFYLYENGVGRLISSEVEDA